MHKKCTPPIRRLDFLARLIKTYGGKRLKVSGAELMALERDNKGLAISSSVKNAIPSETAMARWKARKQYD